MRTAEDFELMRDFREFKMNLDEIRQGIKDWKNVIKKIKDALEPGDEILKNDLKNHEKYLGFYYELESEEEKWLNLLLEGLDKFARKYNPLFNIGELGTIISKARSYIRRVLLNNIDCHNPKNQKGEEK
jgi:hypothetical protein